MQLEPKSDELNQSAEDTLSSIIQKEGALDSTRAMTIFLQIAEALSALHGSGAVYGDLRPEKILVIQNIRGEAAAVLPPDTTGSGTGNTVSGRFRAARGSASLSNPRYMSPEQCQGEPPTPQSDIYAFGCMMFEALTGQPPFTGETDSEVVEKQLNQPTPRISSVAPTRLPPLLQAVIDTALKKQPGERYESFDELKEDLTAGLEQAKAQQRPTRPPSGIVGQKEPSPQHEAARESPVDQAPPIRDWSAPKAPAQPREALAQPGESSASRARSVSRGSAMRGGGSPFPIQLALMAVGGLVVVGGLIFLLVQFFSNMPKSEEKASSTELPSELWVCNDKQEVYFEPATAGDTKNVKADPNFKFKPHSGATCYRLVYKPSKRDKDPKRYGAAYWLNPADNWGKEESNKNGGLDLSQYERLTVWARADAPTKVTFQVGGIKAPYGDSLENGVKSNQKISSGWRKYTIEMPPDKSSLKHIINGFSCSISVKDNPKGGSVYLDDIRYEQ